MSRRIHRRLLVEELEPRVAPAILVNGTKLAPFLDTDGDWVQLKFSGDGQADVQWVGGGANPLPAGDEVATVTFGATTLRSAYSARISTAGNIHPTLTGGVITGPGLSMGKISLASSKGTVEDTDIDIGVDVNQILITGILDNSMAIGNDITIGGITSKIRITGGLNETALTLTGYVGDIYVKGNVTTMNALTPITCNAGIGKLTVTGIVSSFVPWVGAPVSLITINGNANQVALKGGIHSEENPIIPVVDVDISGSCNTFTIGRYAWLTDIEIGSVALDRAGKINIFREFVDGSLTVAGTTGTLTFKDDRAGIGLRRSAIILGGDTDGISLFGVCQDSALTVAGNVGYIRRGRVYEEGHGSATYFFTMTIAGDVLQSVALPYLFGTGSRFTANNVPNLSVKIADGSVVTVNVDLGTMTIAEGANLTRFVIGGNVLTSINCKVSTDHTDFNVGGSIPYFNVSGTMASSSLIVGWDANMVRVTGSLDDSVVDIGNDATTISIGGSMESSGLVVGNDVGRIKVVGGIEGIFPGLGSYDAWLYDPALAPPNNPWAAGADPITENRTSVYVDAGGNAYMVWEERDDAGEDWEIWYAEAPGGGVRLTDNDRDDFFPSIFVDEINATVHIVWQWEQEADPGDWEICYLTFPVGLPPAPITDNAPLVVVTNTYGGDNAMDDLYPMIDQSSTPTSVGFAWQQSGGTDQVICYSTINPSTFTITQVLTETDNVIGLTPAINNRNIAFVRLDAAEPTGADYEIWYWRNSNLTQVTSNAVDDLNPSIYWWEGPIPVQRAYIAWEQYATIGLDPEPGPFTNTSNEVGVPRVLLWDSVAAATIFDSTPAVGECSMEPSVWWDPVTWSIGLAYQHKHLVGDYFNYDIYYWSEVGGLTPLTYLPTVDPFDPASPIYDTRHLPDDITPWLHNRRVAYSCYDAIPEPTLDVGRDLTTMTVGGEVVNVDMLVGRHVLDRIDIQGNFSDEDILFDLTIGGNARVIAIGNTDLETGSMSGTAAIGIVGDLISRLSIRGSFAVDSAHPTARPAEFEDPLIPFIECVPYLEIGGTADGSRIEVGGYMTGAFVVWQRYGNVRIAQEFNGAILAGLMGINNTFWALDSPAGLVDPANAFQSYHGYP